MPQIFISHASRDEIETRALVQWLATHGYDNIFLDTHPAKGIFPGDHWIETLSTAAARSRAFICLLSPDWLQSDWCRAEYLVARMLGKHIYGVCIRRDPATGDAIGPDSLPDDNALQIVDLTQPGPDRHLTITDAGEQETGSLRVNAEALDRLENGLKRQLSATRASRPPRPRQATSIEQPYLGLRPFEEADSAIYFGREAETAAVLQTLKRLNREGRSSVFVIQGASGAGKSSFLRAGLLPYLRHDSRHYLVLPAIRPAPDALGALSEAIDSVQPAHRSKHQRSHIRACLEAGAEALQSLLLDLLQGAQLHLGKPDTEMNLVLPIDQAEELFEGSSTATNSRFLERIAELLRDQALPVTLIMTIRSNTYERLQKAPLLEGIEQTLYSLPPLPLWLYPRVINGPLEVLSETRDFEMEDALVAALLKDVEDQRNHDPLPLLSFTLQSLFQDYGGAGRLTLRDYAHMDRINGAISKVARGALETAARTARLPPDPKHQLVLLRQALIPWLVDINPETTQIRRRVARMRDIPPEAHGLIHALADNRLVSVQANSHGENETIVELAHEALTRQWPDLRDVLDGMRGDLIRLAGIRHAAAGWDRNGRRDEWLNHRGRRLKSALDVAESTELQSYLGPMGRDYLAVASTVDAATVRRRRNRRRLYFGSAAGLTLVALLVAVYVNLLRLDAEDSRTLAIQASEGLILDIARDLRANEGLRPQAARQILDRAQKVLDDLAQNRPDDPGLFMLQIQARLQAAETLFKLRARGEAAAQAARAAAALRERLERSPDPDLKRELGRALNWIGDTRQQVGDADGTARAYHEALAIAKALRQLEPHNRKWLRDLSVSHDRLGIHFLSRGQTEYALDAFRQSFEIRSRLISEHGDNPQWQRELSVSLNNLARAHLRQGAAATADKLYHRAFQIREDLSKSDTLNTQWQRDLAVAHLHLGDTALSLNNSDDALQHFRAAMQIGETMRARGNSDPGLQRDISLALNKIGEAHRRQGDTLSALTAFQRAFKLRKTLADSDPENTAWQRDLAVSLSLLGDMNMQIAERQQQQGNTGKARTHNDTAKAAYATSHDIRQKLLRQDPAHIGRLKDLSLSFQRLAAMAIANGANGDARTNLKNALKLSQQVADTDPTNQIHLSHVLDDIIALLPVLPPRQRIDHVNRALMMLEQLDHAAGGLSPELQRYRRFFQADGGL